MLGKARFTLVKPRRRRQLPQTPTPTNTNSIALNNILGYPETLFPSTVGPARDSLDFVRLNPKVTEMSMKLFLTPSLGTLVAVGFALN
jgi:hypothetical protein